MPVTEKIKAAVERMQEGEKIGASTHFSQPVTKLLDVPVITKNVEIARKVEPEIADLLAKRDKQIVKARSDKTVHPEVVKQQVKDIETRTNAEMDALLAKLDENAPLLEGQREFYSHEKCLQRAQFSDPSTRNFIMLRLSRLSGPALIDAARLALASADAATMGCIADETDVRKDLSREMKAELNALIAQVPSDAAKVKSLLDEYDLRTRRARIASGRATKSVDKIAAGLLARQTAAE